MKAIKKDIQRIATDVRWEYLGYLAGGSDWKLQMLALDPAMHAWISRQMRRLGREAMAQIERAAPVRRERAIHIVERNYYRMMDYWPRGIIAAAERRAKRARRITGAPVTMLN